MFGRTRALEIALETINALREEVAAERAARAFLAQRMTELKTEHARELEEYRRRLSIAQANFEWLSVSHNKVSAEWQTLFNKRMGVELPPIQVAFDRPPSQPSEPPAPAAPALERPYREAVERGSSMGETFGVSFDDVGDAEAQRQGLTGGRLYTGEDVLLRE